MPSLITCQYRLNIVFGHWYLLDFEQVRGDVKICRSLPLQAASGCCGAAAFCRQLK